MSARSAFVMAAAPYLLKVSPRPFIARVLRQITMRGLFADVVLLVVAMALGGVEGNSGRAAGALVALVAVGNRLNNCGQRFRHAGLRYAWKQNAARGHDVPGRAPLNPRVCHHKGLWHPTGKSRIGSVHP